LDLGQLGLQRLDALLVPLAAALARILRGGAAERAQLAFAPVHALAQLLGGAARLLLAHLQALACRARLKGARSQRVVARRALRQGALGVRPALAHGGQAALYLLARRACPRHAPLRLAKRRPAGARAAAH